VIETKTNDMNELDQIRTTLWSAIKTIDGIKAKGMEDEFLDKIKKPVKIKRMPPDVLLKKICDHYHTTPVQLVTNTRHHDFSDKRKVACKIIRDFGMGQGNEPTSYKRIASMLGYQQHATVISHLKLMDKALGGTHYGYDHLAKEYTDIKREIGQL
jgi:chromosomal replication initiation ATPase DnaA